MSSFLKAYGDSSLSDSGDALYARRKILAHYVA